MTPHRSASRAIEPPRFAPAGGDPGEIVWQLRSAAAEDCRRLTEALRIHPATARVLAARGCSTPASATRFLDPTWDDILDPAAIAGLRRARLPEPFRQFATARGSWFSAITTSMA